MKKKCFLIAFIASFLCYYIAGQTLPVDSQNTDNTKEDTAGIWLFEKAEFKACQYGTENVVETINIDNVSALDTAGFHFETVFREIEISERQILVVLGNRYRNSIYRLEGDRLNALNSNEKDRSDDPVDSEEQPSFVMLQPYLYSRSGDKMQFNFKYPYGDSRYKFSLEGKLSVIYIKSNKTNKQIINP
jgi:hypothetical protein